MEFLSFMFLCFFFLYSSVALDTMSPNQTLQDNGQALFSIDESFALGFFSPRNSNNRYIGIWFKNVPEQTVVWVANKDNPITDSSGVLTITSTGNIVIKNSQSGIAVWSSNSTGANPVLQLLYTGNLVVKNGGNGNNSENYIWQSFDHPCDTLLPGMKLGSNLVTGLDWYLTSWKSTQDPSTGEFTYRVDHQGLPQLVLRRGSELQFRSGPWDGLRFGGGPKMKSTRKGIFEPIFVFNSTHAYYSFKQDKSVVSRFVLNQSGLLQHRQWKDGGWRLIETLNNDECDGTYNKCGSYGICKSIDDSICECPSGFIPKSPQDWNAQQNSAGCVARKPLKCRADDGFRKFKGLKLPDSSYLNRTVVSPAECEKACLSNCSCVAYARTGVSACVVWFAELKDIRRYIKSGQVLHIRMAASELGKCLPWI